MKVELDGDVIDHIAAASLKEHLDIIKRDLKNPPPWMTDEDVEYGKQMAKAIKKVLTYYGDK